MSGNGASRAVGARKAAAGGFLEVACDESGSDGENLTGGNTDVFAHASVTLPVDRAEERVREIRRGAGSGRPRRSTGRSSAAGEAPGAAGRGAASDSVLNP